MTFWSAIEPCAGIVSACMPSLRPLVTLVLRSLHVKLPNFHREQVSRPDSGASTMPWIKGAKMSCIKDVEMQWPQNSLITVPSAMSQVFANQTRTARKAGPALKVEEIEVPYGAIKVKTEIRWSISERLDYDCRIY